MNLRITSNGIGYGTRVENAATGETIDGIEHVDISIPATGLVFGFSPSAIITRCLQELVSFPRQPPRHKMRPTETVRSYAVYQPTLRHQYKMIGAIIAR